jgi:hypothetical protein
MTGRPSSRPLLLALALAAAVAGCGRDRTPRRAPDDGAPCSAIMPGTPESEEATFRLDSVVMSERGCGLKPPEASVDPPKDLTVYVVRRVTVPAGAALRDAALLDAAAARVARGIALQAGTKPSIAKVATAGGDAVELRWPMGKLHNATRLLLIPGGYCEVTIMGAYTEADVASYLASAQVRPDGKR